MSAGVVDEIAFFLSPKIIGGRDAITPVEGLGAACVSKAKIIREMKVKKIGTDLLITGKVG
jgi:diaminohydroxyphosphoribosylaminopyrimidine deaminase/5-amino-6-(5-phosphoribosylamino)uracil reductase